MPTAASLPPFGVFSGHLNLMPAARAQHVVRQWEELGYGVVWLPESGGKEAFTHAATILAGTRHIVVATGIANIWARDAMAMVNAARTLQEAYPGRLLLGVGIGHRPSVSLRGHEFDQPLETMASYLDAMDRAPFRFPHDVAVPARVLGALGPRMLTLAAERADGAVPYLVPVDHTRWAREHMGPDALLAPEQAVVLTTDPPTARRIGREHVANYLLLDNYRRSLQRWGFDERDLDDGGSDALVDSLVAWGTPEDVVGRVLEHLDAGADHVALQVLGPRYGWSSWSYASLDRPELRQGQHDLPMDAYRQLAPWLLG